MCVFAVHKLIFSIIGAHTHTHTPTHTHTHTHTQARNYTRTRIHVQTPRIQPSPYLLFPYLRSPVMMLMSFNELWYICICCRSPDRIIIRWILADITPSVASSFRPSVIQSIRSLSTPLINQPIMRNRCQTYIPPYFWLPLKQLTDHHYIIVLSVIITPYIHV